VLLLQALIDFNNISQYVSLQVETESFFLSDARPKGGPYAASSFIPLLLNSIYFFLFYLLWLDQVFFIGQ
jgi:hypothetical protein